VLIQLNLLPTGGIPTGRSLPDTSPNPKMQQDCSDIVNKTSVNITVNVYILG